MNSHALTAEEVETIKAVLEHYGAGTGTQELGMNTWSQEAEPATDTFSKASADNEPTSAREVTETQAAHDDAQEVVIQTAPLLKESQPDSLMPSATAESSNPVVDVAEGGEEWTTLAAIEAEAEGYLDEEDMPTDTAPSKGDFESASALINSFPPISPHLTGGFDGEVSSADEVVEYNDHTISSEHPADDAEVSAQEDAARDALVHLKHLTGAYEEAAQRAVNAEPREEYRSQVEAIAAMRDNATNAETDSDVPVVLEEQELPEGFEGEQVDPELQTQAPVEADDADDASVDQHMGERAGDEGGFRSATQTLVRLNS